MDKDIPSPIDWRSGAAVCEWAASAMEKRPCRTEIFEAMANELKQARRVLELGSDPGFLA